MIAGRRRRLVLDDLAARDIDTLRKMVVETFYHSVPIGEIDWHARIVLMMVGSGSAAITLRLKAFPAVGSFCHDRPWRDFSSRLRLKIRKFFLERLRNEARVCFFYHREAGAGLVPDRQRIDAVDLEQLADSRVTK
jgi:hypothetical protein